MRPSTLQSFNAIPNASATNEGGETRFLPKADTKVHNESHYLPT